MPGYVGDDSDTLVCCRFGSDDVCIVVRLTFHNSPTTESTFQKVGYVYRRPGHTLERGSDPVEPSLPWHHRDPSKTKFRRDRDVGLPDSQSCRDLNLWFAGELKRGRKVGRFFDSAD